MTRTWRVEVIIIARATEAGAALLLSIASRPSITRDLTARLQLGTAGFGSTQGLISERRRFLSACQDRDRGRESNRGNHHQAQKEAESAATRQKDLLPRHRSCSLTPRAPNSKHGSDALLFPLKKKWAPGSIVFLSHRCREPKTRCSLLACLYFGSVAPCYPLN